jgi:hypothetical protein
MKSKFSFTLTLRKQLPWAAQRRARLYGSKPWAAQRRARLYGSKPWAVGRPETGPSAW